MNIDERILTYSDIEKDLEDISKKIYLKSPDIWLDFRSKVADEVIDEMILFYAAKYNYSSILKYVMDNNSLDLNGVSKQKSYNSIKEHLLSVAKDCNSYDFYNLLSENINNTEDDNPKERDKAKEKNNYSPIFICPHCNTNVLSTGYKIFEEISFAFSEKNNKLEEINRVKNDNILCCNCNNHLKDVTINLLENLCSIHHCNHCGKDLIKIGINKKEKLIFNEKDNKFNKKEKTYNCPNCDTELNKSQIEYFNL